jgi:PAT family beta-lactamase induction signal transducer AmpG
MPSSISAVNPDAATPARIPALSESKFARFAAIILLYFMQGVPVGLTLVAIPAWLAANGAGPVEVGAFVGTALLPWSLKLFGGLLMDRFTFRPMGRRRVWILTAQALMACVLISLALGAPGPAQIGQLAMFCFVLNACAVVNDIATDGMTVDLVPHEERTTINGLMFGAQWLGIAVTGFVAGEFLAASSMTAVGFTLAGLVICVSVFIMLFRERTGERRMPWSTGQASAECEARQQKAWWPILKGLFRNVLVPPTLLFLLAMFLGSATAAHIDAVAPTLAVQQLGWTSDGYSRFASLAGFSMGVTGALAAPVFVKLLGLRNSMIGMCLVLSACALWAGAAYDNWETSDPFMVITSIQLFFGASTVVVSVVWAMRICDPAIAASLFALFMAVPNFGRSVMAGWSGVAVETVGYGGTYFAVAAITLASLGILLLARFGDERTAARLQGKHNV